MYWNSTQNILCTFGDIYNASGDNKTLGNATQDSKSGFLNLYNCFHKQLTVKDKALEISSTPLGIIPFIVSCLSLFANCTTILTITKMSPKESMHLKLIVSLCLSDTLISFSILFDDLMYIFTQWDSCVRLCKRLVLDLSILATLMNLFAMAFDHHRAIIKSIHYRQLMTQFQMNCLIIGLWVVSVSAVLLEIFVGLGLKAENKHKLLCEAIEAGPDNLEIFIVSFIFVVLFGIMSIYTRIYCSVRTLMPGREVTSNQTDSGSFKALVTSLLFIGTFELLWAPDGVFHIVMYIMSKTNKGYITQHVKQLTLVNDVLFLILQLNSLADPVIYAFRLPKCRRGYANVFLCQRKRVKKQHESLFKQATSGHCSNTCKEHRVECCAIQEVIDGDRKDEAAAQV